VAVLEKQVMDGKGLFGSNEVMEQLLLPIASDRAWDDSEPVQGSFHRCAQRDHRVLLPSQQHYLSSHRLQAAELLEVAPDIGQGLVD
jgi:hypothetical protein